MKTKWIAAGVVAVIACVVGGMLLNHQQPARQIAPPKQIVSVDKAPPVQPETAPVTETVAPAPAVTSAPSVQSQPTAPKSPAAQNQAQKPPKEPLHDPDAREALALVGVDPEAERYWLNAIYDTSLPDNEREDLMEDLNEVGFADPKNLSADDLPLIATRLEIIEQIAQGADPFMSEHLGEAYKDLWNMYGKVAGR